MKVPVERLRYNASWVFPWILGILLLTGCQTAQVPPAGGDVPASQRIAIVRGQDASGQWQTRDLALGYQFMVEQNDMQLAVQVRFSESVTMGFRQLRRFHVKLYWLDGFGRVLTTRGLYSVSQANTDDGITFTSNIPVPVAANAMAFGYSGELRGQGLRGTVSPIWYVPTTAIGGAGK